VGSRGDTLRRKAKRLAHAIAEELFVNGMGKHAERLVLTDAEGRDLGGWGREPVEDLIRDIIAASRNVNRG
jgi:hypothetical protein